MSCPIHKIPLTESPYEDTYEAGKRDFCWKCEEEWKKAWIKPKVKVLQLTKPPKVTVIQRLAKPHPTPIVKILRRLLK